MAFTVVAGIGAAISAVSGIAKTIKGKEARDEAKIQADAAKAELDLLKDKFEGLDTSNPYANLTNFFDDLKNTYEDMTVDQRAAEFQAQQQQQSQANILEQLRGAAGGAGVGAVAQALARQASVDAQRSAADIGAQERQIQTLQREEESRIQQLQATEGSRIQGMEREGEILSRQAEGSKLQTLMGFTGAEMEKANRDLQLATQMMYSGIGEVGGSFIDLAGVGADLKSADAAMIAALKKK
tara:strand:+ start:75 stop:797 length:723 start_codon:yes stop_codon:yes gene_type:complete